ncbi:MAG TPA: hypothetical protein VMW04_02610 [Patescibacteria group bacterium]|nr:hypothetical protein [Patescibacteria group bacterium]
MNQDYPFPELRQRLDQAQKILILLPAKPSFDQVAAGLSLSLALEEMAKNVSVVCSTAMTVEFNHLVGVNRIAGEAQGTDLIISLNYPADQVEKVSYNDDNNRPNVIIQPKVGAPALKGNQVGFAYAGAGADLIMTLGIKDLNQLQSLGFNLNDSFLVNIDADPQNVGFGHLNIVDLEAAALSEVALGLVVGLGLKVSVDIAQNVLSGIWRRTRGLTAPQTGANTYEAVAIALRSGAQKPLEETAPFKREAIFTPKAKSEGREGAPATPTFVKPQEEKKASEEKPQPPSKPPADWFEPKIFKGTNFTS